MNHDVLLVPVGELFSLGGDRYSIPLYQRNYTWGEEQISRLLNDILDAYSTDQKTYFLGNLVTAPPLESDQNFDVIDGQQRLTTLFLLLTALRKTLQHETKIGKLQPLVYEGRDKATRALRGIRPEARSSADDREDGEDVAILHAIEIIDGLLAGPAKEQLVRPEVIDFLLQDVVLVRMPIDRSMDLNKYFEVMNTRGAQLSQVDIVKAQLMRHLEDPADRELLNLVWSACSDMEHYVAMTLTSGDTNWRSAVFGSDWTELPSAIFATLRQQLIIDRAQQGSEPTWLSTPYSSASMSFSDALRYYAKQGIKEGREEADRGDRFTSQITFPTLLLHVLAIRSPSSGDGARDRQLDDKLLVSAFNEQLKSPLVAEPADWVRAFTTDLLRIRFLFDKYILKRDATLSSGHESTTDEEPGSWSLHSLRKSASSNPGYSPTFSSRADTNGIDRTSQKVLLLQSALRITYTSPRAMHWITEALRHVTQRTDLGLPITARGLLDVLESYALSRVEEAIRPDPAKFEPGQLDDNLMPTGFAIPRIVYTYLDYLLLQEENQWEFVFRYRTSIEHFSPGTEDMEHSIPEYHLVDEKYRDWLGNLALVTVRVNSKFGNSRPDVKADNTRALEQSSKLKRMAEMVETRKSWKDEDIREHHEAMVQLLEAALAARPLLQGR